MSNGAQSPTIRPEIAGHLQRDTAQSNFVNHQHAYLVRLRKCGPIESGFEPQYSKAPLAPHKASQAARPACETPKLAAIVHVMRTSTRVDQRIHGAVLRT